MKDVRVIARAYLVAGQAEPAPRDPRGGGFDPGDAAAFAAASAPSLPGGGGGGGDDDDGGGGGVVVDGYM